MHDLRLLRKAMGMPSLIADTWFRFLCAPAPFVLSGVKTCFDNAVVITLSRFLRLFL